jgi:tRNA nucleotidyltransferase (CCA-adding enzyme)
MKDFPQFREAFGQNLLSLEPSLKIIEWQKQGLLKKHLQPIDKCVGIKQDDKFHIDDVFQHCVKTCDNVPPELCIRWAGLLHDIGKAHTRSTHLLCGRTYPEIKAPVTICPLWDKKCNKKCEHAIKRTTFYKHELASERLAKMVLKQYQVSQRAVKIILGLINTHMYNYDCSWTDKAVARFVRKSIIKADDLQNPDMFPLFQLRIADRKSRGLKPVTQKQRDFEHRLKEYFGLCLE